MHRGRCLGVDTPSLRPDEAGHVSTRPTRQTQRPVGQATSCASSRVRARAWAPSCIGCAWCQALAVIMIFRPARLGFGSILRLSADIVPIFLVATRRWFARAADASADLLD
jgi:hypothetical protein